MQVFATILPSEIRLVLRDKPELVAGVIAFALLGGQLWLAALRELWPFIVIPIVGVGAYLPLVENDRYLRGFVLVLFLALLAAGRFRRAFRTSVISISAAVFVMMALGIGDYTVRIVTHHMAIPGNGPNSTLADVITAEALGRMGVAPGTKVADIGDGGGAFGHI